MKYYSAQAASRVTGKSERTIRNWIRTGRLRAVKSGKVWRVSESDLLQAFGDALAVPEKGSPEDESSLVCANAGLRILEHSLTVLENELAERRREAAEVRAENKRVAGQVQLLREQIEGLREATRRLEGYFDEARRPEADASDPWWRFWHDQR